MFSISSSEFSWFSRQDFYNWNRVKLRYSDGASFAGEGQDEVCPTRTKCISEFRGQHIWSVAMEELMAVGMRAADHALLSGCSAGGLASILHCDQFGALFSAQTKVKCLSDAGLFLDAMDVSGGRTLRKFYESVVTYLGAGKNLLPSCTSHTDPTSCFFPQNLIASIKTPLFSLNATYDSWQVAASLAPKLADPRHEWDNCRTHLANGQWGAC